MSTQMMLWERRGVHIRIEIGPKEANSGKVAIATSANNSESHNKNEEDANTHAMHLYGHDIARRRVTREDKGVKMVLKLLGREGVNGDTQEGIAEMEEDQSLGDVQEEGEDNEKEEEEEEEEEEEVRVSADQIRRGGDDLDDFVLEEDVQEREGNISDIKNATNASQKLKNSFETEKTRVKKSAMRRKKGDREGVKIKKSRKT